MSLVVQYECNRTLHHPTNVIGTVEWTIEWTDPAAPGIDLAVNCPVCRLLCQAKHFKTYTRPGSVTPTDPRELVDVRLTFNTTTNKWKAEVQRPL